MKTENTENQEQEKVNENHSDNCDSTQENHSSDAAENQEEDPLIEENNSENTEENWQEKYLEEHDKFVRLHAEFDNFRKRTNKERIELTATANAGILKDLIPVLDDFERAISSNETATEIESVKEGFLLIYNKYKGILESKGLKPMHSKGEVFDSEFHEAIANIPADSDEMKGKIIEDVEKGYTLHDKVVRFAKVVVGQ
ncbi:MAG: nucleotide exchange factor GrpE [Bacteroidota bacterium]